MGIEVRWFSSYTHMGMTFVNPEKDSGYVLIELILPHQEPASRPVFRVMRKADKEAFNRFWDTYKLLWEAGTDPPALPAPLDTPN